MEKKCGKKRDWIWKTVLYLVMTLLAMVFVFPFFAMVSKSLMSSGEYWSATLKLFPDKVMWANYKDVFTAGGESEGGISYMLLYLWNTLKICFLATVGLLLSASFCAFGFTKIKFPGRNLIFAVTLATTMIPQSIMIIPLYALYSRFGWIDTHYPMWVGMWFGGGAINIFLVMQFMRSLPKELTESAQIDGANIFRRYFQIVLPNCKTILAVIAVGAIVGPWNDIKTPLMYLESQAKYTLALGLSQMRIDNLVDMPVLLAGCVLMTVLPLAAFVFNQKFFVESVITSGIKG